MNKRILYPTDNGLAVITPLDQTLSLQFIAAKDVPAGIPYIIVDASDLPSDISLIGAWEADFCSPDGYGHDFGYGSNTDVISKIDNIITLRNNITGEITTREVL